MKPIIGITVEVKEDGNYYMPSVYGQAISQAGGIPVLIPLIPDMDIDELCEKIDGLFLTMEGFSLDKPKDICSNYCSNYHQAIEFMGKRWMGMIIYTLLSGSKRYNEIK